MKRIISIATCIILAASTSVAQDFDTSFSWDNLMEKPVKSAGAGYWFSNSRENPANGVAFNYSNEIIHMSAAIDTKTKNVGYLLAGPRLTCPKITFYDEYQICLPVFAVMGAADFPTGKFDFGIVIGAIYRRQYFGVGIQYHISKFAQSISLQLHF